MNTIEMSQENLNLSDCGAEVLLRDNGSVVLGGTVLCSIQHCLAVVTLFCPEGDKHSQQLGVH